MNFIFRTDSSNDMGSGHVMRCLTIADALRKEGGNCSFICREHEGSFLELIREYDFEVHALPLPLSIKGQSSKQSLKLKFDTTHASWLGVEWQKDAEESRIIIGDKKVDCLIVDHYSIDIKWERAMRSSCDHLMVIDDLANRPHDCDVLLDQNFDEVYRYSDLVPSNCLLLIGPRYALLRNEFQIARLQKKSNTVNRILVFFGGTDIDDITGATLSALSKTDLSKIWVDIVIGANYNNIDLLNEVDHTV